MSEKRLCMHCARLDFDTENPERRYQYQCDYDSDFHWIGEPVTSCSGFKDHTGAQAAGFACNY